MKLLSLFKKKPRSPIYIQKVYIDKVDNLSFIYYNPDKLGNKNYIAVTNWLNSLNIDGLTFGRSHTNNKTNIVFRIGKTKTVIPKNKVLVFNGDSIKIMEPECIELLFGHSILKI